MNTASKRKRVRVISRTMYITVVNACKCVCTCSALRGGGHDANLLSVLSVCVLLRQPSTARKK